MSKGHRLRVCFVAEHPASGTIGGAEVAMSILADELANEGVCVQYVSQRHFTARNIRLHRIPYATRIIEKTVRNRRRLGRLSTDRGQANASGHDRSGSGAMGKLRFVLDRIYKKGYKSALSHANADLYIQVCAGRQTAYVADYCGKNAKPFIFRSTSLWDADLTFTWGWTTWSEYTRSLYLEGLAQADIVACNSKHTAESFSKHVSEDKVRFLPDGFRITPRSDLSRDDGYILWVGRDKPYKRPSLFADLARRLPAYTFIMVGDIRTIQNPPSNLRLLGPKKPGELPRIYLGAKLLVNTSEVEGFPNVLVEAAIHGVPYVGFLDPDGVVAQHLLGTQSKDLDDMAGMVHMLMGDEDLRLKLGMNARRFVEEHHDIEKVAKRWLGLFHKLTA